LHFKFHGIIEKSVDASLARDGNAALGKDSMRGMADKKRDAFITKLLLEASQLPLMPGLGIDVNETET